MVLPKGDAKKQKAAFQLEKHGARVVYRLTWGEVRRILGRDHQNTAADDAKLARALRAAGARPLGKSYAKEDGWHAFAPKGTPMPALAKQRNPAERAGKLVPTHDAISRAARGYLNPSEKDKIRKAAVEQARTLEEVSRRDVGLLLYTPEVEEIQDSISNAKVVGDEYALVNLPALYVSMAKLTRKMNAELDRRAKAEARNPKARKRAKPSR